MSATLKLTREGAGIELRRGTFVIQLDGTSVGSIALHGEVVNFRTHGAMVWPRYVASLIKPDLSIALKRE